jgi:hypothetical protein
MLRLAGICYTRPEATVSRFDKDWRWYYHLSCIKQLSIKFKFYWSFFSWCLTMNVYRTRAKIDFICARWLHIKLCKLRVRIWSKLLYINRTVTAVVMSKPGNESDRKLKWESMISGFHYFSVYRYRIRRTFKNTVRTNTMLKKKSGLINLRQICG